MDLWPWESTERDQLHRRGKIPRRSAAGSASPTSPMNAIAPPPRPAKRKYGTGTISFHRPTSKWRYRLPGGRIECGGYETAEEAEAALNGHLTGYDPKLLRLRKHLRIVLDLAALIGVSVDRELATVRNQRMIEWARARRAKRQTKEEGT